MDLKTYFSTLITNSDAYQLMTPTINDVFPLKYDQIQTIPGRSQPGTVNHTPDYLALVAESLNAMSKADFDTLVDSVHAVNSAILIGLQLKDRHTVRT